MLLEVAKELATTDPSVKLLLAGSAEPVDGIDGNVISDLMRLPNVRMLEHRPDVRSVYFASDVLALFTKREGLPTVILEASACGLHTVATRATGTVDAVIPGINGKIIEQGDVAAAIHALRNILEHRLRLGSDERTRILHPFERSAVQKAWIAHLSRNELSEEEQR
jgi:glycosyltransferase involved in cell wall biosynthesis